MMLHETDEQRAMDGELKVLDQHWHGAEDIAAIADSLTCGGSAPSSHFTK